MDSKDDALEVLSELEHADIQSLSCCSEDSLSAVTDLSMDLESEEEGCEIPIYTSAKIGGRQMGFRTEDVLNYVRDLKDVDISCLYGSNEDSLTAVTDLSIDLESDEEGYKIPIYTSVKIGGRQMGFRTEDVLNYLSDLEDFDISSLYSEGSNRTMSDTREQTENEMKEHATMRSTNAGLQSQDRDHEHSSSQEADTPIGRRQGSLQAKDIEETKPQTASVRAVGGIASKAEIRKEAACLSETVSPKSLPTLHRAVWKGKLNKVFKYLSRPNNRRKVNKLDRLGRTALMLAAAFDRSEMVRILLMFGADPALKDRDNDKAMSYAPKPSKSAEVIKQFLEESESRTAETTVKDHHKQVERVVSEKSAKQIISSNSKKPGEQSGTSLRSAIQAQVPAKEDDLQSSENRNSTTNGSSERPSLFKRVRSMFIKNQRKNQSAKDLTAEEWAIEYKLLAMKYDVLAKELQASNNEILAMTNLLEKVNLSREGLQRLSDKRIIAREQIRFRHDLLQDNLLASRSQSSDLNLRFSQLKTWFGESLDFVRGLHKEKEQLLVKKESDMKLINRLINENNSAAEEILRLRKATSIHPNF